MTNIGSAVIARALYRHFNGTPRTYDRMSGSGFKRAPNGFRRIGSGCYRVVYLHKESGLVYKIGDNDANFYEAENASRLRAKSSADLGFELVVPRTRYVTVDENAGMGMAIQEFAPNARATYCMTQYNWGGVSDYDCTCKRKDVCYGDVHRAVEAWSGLEDIHCYNVLVDRDDRFWLIDLAG